MKFSQAFLSYLRVFEALTHLCCKCKAKAPDVLFGTATFETQGL